MSRNVRKNGKVTLLARLSAAFGSMMLMLLPATSQASGIIPTVAIGAEYHGYASPEAACQAQLDLGLRNPNGYGANLVFQGLQVRSWLGTGGSGTWINGVVAADTPYLGGWLCEAIERYIPTGDNWVYGWIWMYPECPGTTPGTYQSGFVSICPNRPIYYVAALPKAIQLAENGNSCSEAGAAAPAVPKMSHCGDPINPTNGNTYAVTQDLPGSDVSSLKFKRYYNSTDTNSKGLGVASWRGSFSRSIKANARIASYQPLSSAGSTYSSLYNDEASACVSGFSQIKAQVTNWSTATASFSNGVCSLSKGGVIVGSLAIYSAYNYNISPETSPPSYDYISDSGHVIRFSVANGVIAAPPGYGLRLTHTASGYILTDGNDTVEEYDTNGKLLTVTSRAGVVQTMNYDSSGKLSSVVDNFGHQLILSYDGQNRLTSVTRQ